VAAPTPTPPRATTGPARVRDHRQPTPTARERTGESSAATPVRVSFGEVLHAPAQADADGAQYDRTTLIKTILLAFARNPGTALARMPGRVQRAPDLAHVLLDESRTDVDDPRNARDLIDTWRQQARRRRMALPAGQVAQEATASLAPDGAGHPLVLTDFQSDWQKFATTMRNLGVEP
jgi:hypothetical protein